MTSVVDAAVKCVLNVGGGVTEVPARYASWKQILLDINPAIKPDICCDALEMSALPAATYDAVYCSHTVEHFYRHDVQRLLRGFLHVLKPGGFSDIAVPNLTYLIEQVRGRDLDDVWYESKAGPITFHDVLYGFGRAMEGGNLYYAHKCGFTAASLRKELFAAGFIYVAMMEQNTNLQAFAFLDKPKPHQLRMLEG